MEEKRETEIRQSLEARLAPGEELLAYASGAISGFLSTRSVYLGLTPRRLILLPVEYGKPADRTLSIQRESIEWMKWSGLWSTLKVRLPKDELAISCSGKQRQRLARKLIDAHNTTPIPREDTPLPTQALLEQVKTLRELGLTTSAHETAQRLQAVPESEADTVAPVLKELAERRLALRVGGGFLLASVGLIVLFSVLLSAGHMSINPAVFVSALIDVVIGINLLRGVSHQWVALAVFRAAGGLLLFGLMSLLQGSIPSLVGQAAFSLSLILVLTGKGIRAKTLVAVAIYTIGYLGVVAGPMATAVSIAMAGR